MFNFTEHISWLLILKYQQMNVLIWSHVKYGKLRAIASREYKELVLFDNTVTDHITL